ncbi:MAG TPA: hypothetical protein VHQ41_03055 [Patescibacteria group bacterium]|jgi:hypothetical protein|nr:hypothetical protein [Patescibacteria group bacterium]
MKKFLLVLGIVGALFTFYQFSNSSLIGDDDVYWHIRYSANILTTQHLGLKFFGDPIPYAGVLFHLVLAPFTLIPNLFIAQKIAGIFFVLLVAALSYLLFKKINVRYPELLTILLFLLSVNFSFRLLLVRTFLISIILLLAGVYCFLQKKYWLLYFVAVAYALSYSVPFLLALAGLWVFAQLIVLPRKEVDWRVILIVAAGLITGTMLHPVFPQNIIFLKNYLLPVFYKVPYQNLGGGIELAPFTLAQFIKYEWMISVVWFFSIAVFIKNYFSQKEKMEKLFFILTSVMFFVLAVLSRRFIEYWALFAGLSAFYVFKPFLAQISYAKFKENFVTVWQLKLAAVVFLAALSLGVLNNVLTVHSWAQTSPSILPYEQSGKWLSENIPSGSTVLNSDWTLYPKLYFYNSSVNYIAEFDPAYLYLKSQDLYSKWSGIANEREEEWGSIMDFHKTVQEDFKAQYLVIKTYQNVKLKAFINDNDLKHIYFDQVYSDDTLTVYKVN